MRVGSLCTGYGGIEMGMALAGVDVDVRWHAEVDPFPASLLDDHGPNLGDITRVDFRTVPKVDVLTAGFPCQPFSLAGGRLGRNDERWLWPSIRKAVRHLNPRAVILENVRALLSNADGETFRQATADLVHLGYSVRWTVVGACHVNAAHHRHRLFVVARRSKRPGVQMVPGPLCKRDNLLPTPVARDGQRGAGREHYWMARKNWRSHGMPLDAVMGLVAAHGWDQYGPAVRLHSRHYGRPPRQLMAPSLRGNPLMRAQVAEWVMGLPRGHVTDRLTRAAAFRVIGNGVMPAQMARALEILGWP